MKKIATLNILLIVLIFGLTQCAGDFLDIPPKGVLTEDNLTDVESFVIAAYSYPPKQNIYYSLNPQVYGCIRSDDSYKGGGGGLGDQVGWYQMEVFTLTSPNEINYERSWEGGYAGIRRCNIALQQLNKIDAADFPLKEQRIGEMKFIRGYLYFMLKNYHRWIPYIDENLPNDEYETLPNHPEGRTDLDLWQLILNDFEDAYAVLPETQPVDKARATKYAAEAYIIKTLLWMAYEMDDNHQVVNINQAPLEEALIHCNNIINSLKYSLTADYGTFWKCENDFNNSEVIFEWNATLEDGTTGSNINRAMTLNTPTWPPYTTCCDFHKMSYDYINANRTGPDGLPLFDDYNEAELKNNPDYWMDNTFDPRLSHTAAIPGSPYCYNTSLLFDSAATVFPEHFGYVHSMKELVDPLGPCQYKQRGNSKNVRLVRLSEVLLWKAEILIRLNREDEALPIINQIRQRAANSIYRFSDGTPALNYNIQPYVDGVNCVWTNDYAWEAYVWESRLEFAGEGRRMLDLVRWGIAADVMNAHFDKEKTRLEWMKAGFFTKGRDEFIPIPQPAIVWSKGNLLQNPGY
jgi:hypothetical protein